MKEAEIPDWLGRYEELINDLRCPLRQFEDGKLDFKQFIDEVNNVLERYGYSHVEVDTSRKSRWDAWYDKRRSIIYVSNNVLNMDRRVLGRVFMHEVMHHVLLTKPPTLRLRLYNALSSHPRIFKALLLIATVLSIILLQYTALISLGIIMIIIYYLKQYSESAAEALVAYMVTNRWFSVKGFIKGIEKLEWANEVHRNNDAQHETANQPQVTGEPLNMPHQIKIMRT